MKDKKPNTQIPVIFQNVKNYENENSDDRFLKIKIWLMHTGQNFNGSSFSKEVVDKHLHTLANTPILAFIEENSDGDLDFSDHRMVLHRTTEGGIDLKYLGSAVGVIPEDNNARWETRVADDGEELEYLVVDALMWTKWDEPINIMKEKGFKNQSMELADNYSGNWDKDGVFHFETFSFFGACLLGESVMPAMKSSVAEVQFSKNENIQNTIEDKLQEFYTLFSHEGGNEMSKEIPAIQATPVLDMFTEAQFAEATEMNVAFNTVEPESTEAVVTEPIQEFALTASQLREQLRIAIGKEKHTDQWGDVCRKYWYVDHTDTVVIVEDYQDGYQLYSVGYTLTGDTVEIQTDTAFKVKVEYVPFEGASEAFSASFERFEKQAEPVTPDVDNTLEENFTALTTEHETLKSQLDELNVYKRQREESDLKAKFEGKLSDEEFNQVFTELNEDTLEKVEEKLFALIGKKNFSIQPTQKTNVNKVTILSPKEDHKPFGGFFD